MSHKREKQKGNLLFLHIAAHVSVARQVVETETCYTCNFVRNLSCDGIVFMKAHEKIPRVVKQPPLKQSSIIDNFCSGLELATYELILLLIYFASPSVCVNDL